MSWSHATKSAPTAIPGQSYPAEDWLTLEAVTYRLKVGTSRVAELVATGALEMVILPKVEGQRYGRRYSRVSVEAFAVAQGVTNVEEGTPLAHSFLALPALVQGVEETLVLVMDDLGTVLDQGAEREHKRTRNREGAGVHDYNLQRQDGSRVRFRELRQETSWT